MLSLRNGGESLPEIIGRYLGLTTKQVMRGFTVILMILVGSVFVAGPAGLLAKLTPESLDATFWIIVVFAYYILATLLPVDKIIGKIYPLFAVALLFMAVGILVMLYINHPALPELWDGLQNTNPEASEPVSYTHLDVYKRQSPEACEELLGDLHATAAVVIQIIGYFPVARTLAASRMVSKILST